MYTFDYNNIDKQSKINFYNNDYKDEVIFLEGPPFISGKKNMKGSGLHLGHALVSYIKSTLMLYNNNKCIKPYTGTDNHGLPMEMLAMDILNLNTPQDIINYGVEKFNNKCKELVKEYEDKWDPVYNMIGRNIDKAYRYRTMDYSFMLNIWNVFSKLYKENMIYNGTKILPYDVSAKCCLSNFEANQEYKDINVQTLYVSFDLTNGYNIIAWTTTPWTLPSNIALCINKEGDYVLLNNKYIIEKSYINNFKNLEIKTIEEIKTEELLTYEYYDLFDRNMKHKIVSDNYVVLSDGKMPGSGIVHLSPWYGEDDYNVCIKNNIINKKELLKLINIDEEGNYNNNCKYECIIGKNIFDKETTKYIISKLKSNNNLLFTKDIKHSYPFSPRTHNPLIYKACNSYFVNIENEEFKKKILDNLINTKWNNENAKNRMINWVKDARDWCISRNRYFGTPLPLWISDDKEVIVIDETNINLLNLEKEDIHPEYMKDIVKDNKVYKWCGEVFDCWFESGCVGIYYNNDKDKYISDFVCEGIDQTRGWFYTLLILSEAYCTKIPYKNVICSGLIMDKNGKKFSKSSGNYISPEEIINKYGSDSVRLYLLNSQATDGGNVIFKEDDIKGIKSKLIQYYNSIVYFLEYYNYFISKNNKLDFNSIVLSEFDKWIINMLNELNEEINKNISNYEIRKNINLILNFIEDLTNYYIKFNRNRINGVNGLKEWNTSLCILFYVLNKFNKIYLPFMPFSYQYINEMFNNINKEFINYELTSYNNIDEKFKLFKDIIITLRKARSLTKEYSSIRKSICKIVISSNNINFELINEFIDLIKNEINCLTLCFSNVIDKDEIIRDIKLNYRNINKKEIELVKKDMNEFVKDDDKRFIITKTAKQIKGHYRLYENDMLIDIDLDKTTETEEEDFIRNLIIDVQQKRKDMNLHIFNKIKLIIYCDIKDSMIINKNLSKLINRLRCEIIIIEKDKLEFEIVKL